MRIGVDLDGVVFNTENAFRAYAELFDLKINGGGLVARDEVKVSKRYRWPLEKQFDYIDECLIDIEASAALMPYAREVVELLKADGHELFVITSRGSFKEDKLNRQEIATSEHRLKKEKLNFDKVIYSVEDKLKICKEEKIDLMIEDSFKYVRDISNAGIPVLYFRMLSMKPCPNPNVTEVENWGEIYHYIKLGNYNK